MIKVCLEEKRAVKLLRCEKKQRDVMVRMAQLKKRPTTFQNIPFAKHRKDLYPPVLYRVHCIKAMYVFSILVFSVPSFPYGH